MNLPEGRLVHSRVVDDPGTALAAALDRDLTGYAVLAPQGTLLLEGSDRGVLTFEDGVPVLAYHTGSDRRGAAALADLALPGPYRCELYELGTDDISVAHDADDLRVPPALPAERLAGDDALAERTRAAAPADRCEEESGTDALEAFLADEETVSAIREEARREAERRAAEWGLDDQLDPTEDG